MSELIHWEENPRTITPVDFDRLKERISERGFHDVIKIDTENRILSGNMRKDALEEMGIEEVNVLVPDRKLTTEEMVIIGLESNRNDGTWDWDKAKDLGVESLLKAGFEEQELSEMWNDVGLIDDEEGKPKINEPIDIRVKEGEIYELGEHRLMIGDSTDPEQVNKLCKGEKMDMIYCDPPYNIGLDYSNGVSTDGKYEGEYSAKKDSKKDIEYEEFVSATLRNALANCNLNCHVFYWCDERYIWMIQSIFSKYKVANKRVCLWVKNNFNMTPQVAFNKAYEPCVYGTCGKPYLDKGVRNINEILNNEVINGNQAIEEIIDMFNLWLAKRDNVMEYIHPTQKPISLHEKPLRRCTAPGQNIIDLFGRSGSTLMACEQMKRKCFTMEKDLTFAQKIINRWQDYTGQKAELKVI